MQMSHIPSKPVDAVGSTPGVDVHNHVPNAHNEAHPGAQASNVNAPNNDRRGDAATNTSTSLKGAGTADVTTAPGVISTIDVDLKTPRKQDHPAHGSSGHTHTDTEAHVSQ